MKNMIVCLLVVTLTSSQMWADPGPDQAHANAVKRKVAYCLDHQLRVVVETYDNRRFEGVITESGTDDFVVSYAGQSTSLLYRDVRKIKWQSPARSQITVVVERVVVGAAVMGALYGLVVLLGGTRG